jgi:hypothetical protein
VCGWRKKIRWKFCKNTPRLWGFLNIKNSTNFALFCDPNLFQETVKIFSGSFGIYMKVHIFLVLGFEHFENISK